MTSAARARQRRRELRKEMARVAAFVEREVRAGLAVLDEPVTSMVGTKRDVVVLEGKVEGDRVIVDVTETHSSKLRRSRQTVTRSSTGVRSTP
jgi:thymidine phosphorylase